MLDKMNLQPGDGALTGKDAYHLLFKPGNCLALGDHLSRFTGEDVISPNLGMASSLVSRNFPNLLRFLFAFPLAQQA